MPRLRKTLLILATLIGTLTCAGVSSGPPLSVGAGGAPPTALETHLALDVHPVRVVQGGRFTVMLSGIRPGELAAFTIEPAFHTTGFGGGIMGQVHADRRGTISFHYVVGSQWLLGRWRITAGPSRSGSTLRPIRTTIIIGPHS